MKHEVEKCKDWHQGSVVDFAVLTSNADQTANKYFSQRVNQ